MTDKTEIELLAEALVGYRGINGHYSREDDEGEPNPRGPYVPPPAYIPKAEYAKKMSNLPVRMVAKFPGRCAASGEAIQPGDTVQFNPVTRQRILLKKAGI